MYFINAVLGVVCTLAVILFVFYILALWNKKKFFVQTSGWFQPSPLSSPTTTDQKKFSVLMLSGAYFFVLLFTVLFFHEQRLETALTLVVVTFVFCSQVFKNQRSLP